MQKTNKWKLQEKLDREHKLYEETIAKYLPKSFNNDR